MRLRDQLLSVATAYAAAIDRSEATVSLMLFGSGNQLQRVRDGKRMWSDRIEDALQVLSDRWPPGAAWPAEVPRLPPKASPDSPSPAGLSCVPGEGGERNVPPRDGAAASSSRTRPPDG